MMKLSVKKNGKLDRLNGEDGLVREEVVITEEG